MNVTAGLRAVVLGFVVTGLLAWALVRPDLMVVERVTFEGYQRATPAQLRHLSDLRNGTTIWEVDLGDLASRLQRHPWVASVVARRRLPGTVAVEVVEHEPAVLLAWSSELFYVDAQGRPFLRADSSDLDYPVVTGIGPELQARHPQLPRLALADASWLVAQLDERGLIPAASISEIAFHASRGFTVQLSGSGPDRRTAEVLFGFGDYERQLEHLASLLDRGVDLTSPLHVDVAPPTVAIVRPLDPAAVALATRM